MPALATITSTLPSSTAARSTRPNTASRSVTSAGTATARPPAAVISSATDSAPALFTSLTATACPSRASRSAMPRPMPRAAPVIGRPCWCSREAFLSRLDCAEGSGGDEEIFTFSGLAC